MPLPRIGVGLLIGKGGGTGGWWCRMVCSVGAVGVAAVAGGVAGWLGVANAGYRTMEWSSVWTVA